MEGEGEPLCGRLLRPSGGDAGEAGLEGPDGGVVGEAVVHVDEVGDEVVEEVAGLAAEQAVGEGEGASSGGIQSASMSTQPKRRSNSMRSEDSVKSSSAYWRLAERLPRGSWSSCSTMSQSAQAKSRTGTHPQAVDSSRSAWVSAR